MNPSLDIEYIKKLSKKNKAVRARLGKFLEDKLENDQFQKKFESLLRTSKLAGNIVVAAQKKSGRKNV